MSFHIPSFRRRATILTPLAGLFSATLTAVAIFSYRGANTWLVAWCAVLGCISFTAYIAAYFLFAFKDPDSLRSEDYGLKKIALEKGLIFDVSSRADAENLIKAVPFYPSLPEQPSHELKAPADKEQSPKSN
jgi:hypothetical protein